MVDDLDRMNRARERALAAYAASGRDLSKVAQVMWPVLLISELECETAINGLAGWLENSTGANAVETVEALEEIGARRVGALLREALSFFPGGKPAKDLAVRREQVAAMPEESTRRVREIGREILEWPDDVSVLLAAQARRESHALFGGS